MDYLFWWDTVDFAFANCEFEKLPAFNYTGIRVYERLFLKKRTLFFWWYTSIQVYGELYNCHEFACKYTGIRVYEYTKDSFKKNGHSFYGGIQVYRYTVDFANAMSLKNS